MTEIVHPSTGGLHDPRRLEKFIASRTRTGRTLITRKPIPDPNPEFTGSQKSLRRIVRRAVTYAEFAGEQPIYQNRAVGTSSSAYNLAVADYLGKPEVLELDLRDWGKNVGHAIRIKARDNFMVLSVRLVIREGDCMVEEGEAEQSKTDPLWWTYTSAIPVNRQPGLYLDAFAYDLPGNVGCYCMELR